MTRTSLGGTPLTLCLLLASAGLGFAQDTGVDEYNAENLRYLNSRVVDRTYRTQIKDEMGDKVEGAGKVRRVRFTYDKDDNNFAVRGVLVSFKGILIERYTFASLEEAALFSDHDREKENERFFFEARGKDVIVLSGSKTSSQRRTLALRDAAWTGRASTRATDVLQLTAGEEDSVTRFSKAALDASPDMKGLIGQVIQMADFLGTIPGSTKEDLPNGGFRVVFEDGVMGFTKSDEGAYTLSMHPDEASEGRLSRFLKRASPAPAAAPTSGSNSGGITGALGGAAIPSRLDLDDSGKTYSAKVGDTFTVRLSGSFSGGYSWQVVDLSSRLELVSETNSNDPNGPVGSAGGVDFEFRVKRAGTIELKLDFARAWDPTSTAETVRITINASN